MSDAIRDLFVSVQIEGFDDELQTANEQIDQMASDAEVAGESLDELSTQGELAGESIADSMETAGGSVQSFSELLEEASVGLAAVGGAGLKFVWDSLDAANTLETNLNKMQAIVGAQLPGIVDVFEREVERLNHNVTVGELADWSMPIFAMFPENADMVLKLVEPMNNAILRMGGDTMTAQLAWVALSTAMAGSYDMLIKASRRLKMPIVAGTEAYEVISKLSRENDPLQNLQYTIEALALSSSTNLSGMGFMFENTELKISATERAWGDFMEMAGAPYQPIQGGLSDFLRSTIELATPAGERIGRFVGILGTLAGVLGLWKVGGGIISKALGAIGLSFSLGPFLAVLGVLAAIAFVAEDIWSGLTGGESLIIRSFEAWKTYFTKTLPDAWNHFVAEPIVGFFTETLPGFFTKTLPSAFLTFGHRVKEFFTVTVVNFFIEGINKIIRLANRLPFVDIAEIPLRQYSTVSQIIEQDAPSPTGVMGDYVRELSRELSRELTIAGLEMQPKRESDLGFSFSGPPPSGGSGVSLGSSFAVEVKEGAIVVQGSADPEATAEAVKHMLRDEIVAEIEREIRATVEETVR